MANWLLVRLTQSSSWIGALIGIYVFTDLTPIQPADIQVVATSGDKSSPRRSNSAQPSGGTPPDTASDSSKWTIRIGAGALLVPDFAGAKTYRITPLPSVEVSYKRLATASVSDGLNVALLRTGSFRAGPTLRYRFGQYERDARRDLRGLDDVSGAVEAGTTFIWARSGFGVRGYAGWDLGTGHKGGVAELSAFATKAFRLGARRVIARVGPKVTFASARYFQSYYGVDAGQAAASGLTPYRPAGGLERVGIDGSITYPFARRWAFTLVAGAAELAGQAGRSPRIRVRGSKQQAILGSFLTYSF
ncbi:MipA/OmpV family protein [Sphingomonas koreensis]|nr:MipA/OmpV family protein [Sphingomonas koreensis]